VLHDDNEILQPKLIVFEASIKENEIEVACSQDNSDYDYLGGKLYFVAEHMIVSDEADKSYTIDQLITLNDDYWDPYSAVD
jgi:hypothetical protein